MNYYKQIAEMLGVKLGEKFKIKYHSSLEARDESEYYLTENGLYNADTAMISQWTFTSILRGRAEIVKMPWKPEYDERYWLYSANLEEACSDIFTKKSYNFSSWKIGNCFRTKEEGFNEEKIVKAVKKLIICTGLMFTVESFLPSKETCYKMMVASQVTEENAQKAEDVIKDSVNYIFEKINEK